MLVKSPSLAAILLVGTICVICKRCVDGQDVTFQIERPAVYNRVLFEGERVRLSCYAPDFPTDSRPTVNEVTITISMETVGKTTKCAEATRVPGEKLDLDIPSISKNESQYYCVVEYFDDTNQRNVTLEMKAILLKVHSTDESPQCVLDGSATIYEGDVVKAYCYYSRSEAMDAVFEWVDTCGVKTSVIPSEVVNLNESQTSVLTTTDGIVDFKNGTNRRFVCFNMSSTIQNCIIDIDVEKKPTTVAITPRPSQQTTRHGTPPLTSNTISKTTIATTIAATTNVTNNRIEPARDNNVLIGLMVLVGILIVLVLILISLHLCDKTRRRKKRAIKRVPTVNQHIYENPSFRDRVFGTLPGTAGRDSPQMSRLTRFHLGTFGVQEDLVSSLTSLNSSDVRSRNGATYSPTGQTTKDYETHSVRSMKDDQNIDVTNSDRLDSDSTYTAEVNSDGGNTGTDPENVEDMYIDMQPDTSRRQMLIGIAENGINEISPSYQVMNNDDVTNDVTYTSPSAYPRRESKDDTYGIRVSVSDEDCLASKRESPVATERQTDHAAYGGNDFSSLYATIDKSRLRKNLDKVESYAVETNPPLAERVDKDDENFVSVSPLYSAINRRAACDETVVANSTNSLRPQILKPKSSERPKFAPPSPPTKNH